MSTVEEILLLKGPDVITIAPGTTVREATHKMAQANVGCVIIQQDGGSAGIFTERNLLRRVVDPGLDPDATQVDDVMSSPVETCSPSDDVRKCVAMLVGQSFRHLAVEDNKGAITGIISFRDLLALVLGESKE